MISRQTLDLHLRQRVAQHLRDRHGYQLDTISPVSDKALARLMAQCGCSVECIMIPKTETDNWAGPGFTKLNDESAK
jgi:hypothetical protein